MKKVIAILILSLSLGICNVSAKDHHKEKGDRHRTEQRYDKKPHKDNKHKDKKHHDNGKYRPGNNWRPGSSQPRPGGSYRPTPPPPPRRVYPPRPPRRPHVDPNLAYIIGTANVLFNGLVMQGVSPSTFQVLDYGYARDARYVYYNGKRLKGADPATFRILDDGYARDAWNMYYYGRRVD